MNERLSKDIIDLFNKKSFLDDWLDFKYKEKSLVIYGIPGSGKSTIADYILKDWVKVYIKSDFCKSSKNFEDYLNDTLYKKSITMMFNDKVLKSLIIDDINYIQTNDKKLFKSILDFSKKKEKNNPIIYIFTNINKNLKTIVSKCFPFKIEYKTDFLVNIVHKYFLPNIDKNDIIELVLKSNHNLHNIIVNIDFYKTKFSQINTYDNVNDELSEHIKNIINMESINDIYNNSYSEYMVIGMNILDSFNEFFKKTNIKQKEKLDIIGKVYWNNSISDSIYKSLNETNDWNSINHIITFNTLSSIYYIKKYNLHVKEVPYTKYISKSIIFIHKNKILNTNIDNIEFLYELIQKYLDKKEKDIFMKIKKYIEYHKINLTIAETFLKFFKNYNKDKIKIFY